MLMIGDGVDMMMMIDGGDDDNARATYRRFFKSMGKTVSPAQ